MVRSAYAGKVVLVTGAAGAIGSNLCRRLAQEGAHVLALDDLSASNRWNVPNLESVFFIHGSVLDKTQLNQVFLERPQIVFHLAGFFANQNSIEHPEEDLMVNGMGTLRLLALCERFEIDRLVYASSSAAYNGKSVFPHQEQDGAALLSSPYQITKMLGEQYCNFFASYYGLKVVTARIFNCYGPGEIPGKYRNVIPNFIDLALKGKPLFITGTGDETRDFTYVLDIVQGLLAMGVLDQLVGLSINLGTGIETTIGALAEMINNEIGNRAGVHYVPRRRWDSQLRRQASTMRAEKLLSAVPRTQLKVGLAETIRWFREHWDQIQADERF
jgi:UDP-glucose 4-epimerase